MITSISEAISQQSSDIANLAVLRDARMDAELSQRRVIAEKGADDAMRTKALQETLCLQALQQLGVSAFVLRTCLPEITCLGEHAVRASSTGMYLSLCGHREVDCAKT